MCKALIAMSGGVDSSVAAYMTQKLGYVCIGCTMKLYQNADAGLTDAHTCCSLKDTEDARDVCSCLGMNHYALDYSDEFREKIIDKFVRSYECALTPNPCVDCNRMIKFPKLLELADVLECERAVTGHYVITEKTNDGFLLKKARFDAKDQSYVLYMLDQEQLSRLIFPLGTLTKDEVRQIAKELTFINASKPDSQDICFVPDGDYASVVTLHSGHTVPEGDFVDQNGNVLGRHKGIIHYTVGQRKGLGLSFDSPRYVCEINAADNTVVLGKNEDLFKRELFARDFNWVLGSAPAKKVACKAKIRYRQKEQDATAYPQEDGSVLVEFKEPQRAITPGQAVVLYDGDTVLGGGTIKSVPE